MDINQLMNLRRSRIHHKLLLFARVFLLFCGERKAYFQFVLSKKVFISKNDGKRYDKKNVFLCGLIFFLFFFFGLTKKKHILY